MNVGVMYALLAYIAWGLLPLYWNAFHGVPAETVLGHRIVWSFALVLGLLLWQKRGRDWRLLFRTKGTFWSAAAASALISVNWLLYIVAVHSGKVVEASLGYYINPLVNVVLGVLLLKERPSPMQWTAIVLAGAGVLLLTSSYGKPPWIALALALSFGLYGLCKKKTSVDPLLGLFGETAIALPLAGLYLAFQGGASAPFESPSALWLLASGLATTLPLLWFAQAAKRLPLSTVGLFQYIAPTISLAIGVLLFREPFTETHAWSFALIWFALALYTFASVRGAVVRRRAG